MYVYTYRLSISNLQIQNTLKSELLLVPSKLFLFYLSFFWQHWSFNSEPHAC
jgi:hypothetical protein